MTNCPQFSASWLGKWGLACRIPSQWSKDPTSVAHDSFRHSRNFIKGGLRRRDVCLRPMEAKPQKNIGTCHCFTFFGRVCKTNRFGLPQASQKLGRSLCGKMVDVPFLLQSGRWRFSAPIAGQATKPFVKTQRWLNKNPLKKKLGLSMLEFVSLVLIWIAWMLSINSTTHPACRCRIHAHLWPPKSAHCKGGHFLLRICTWWEVTILGTSWWGTTKTLDNLHSYCWCFRNPAFTSWGW